MRLGADGARLRADRRAAVMIVAGWADGYRNNSFRTVAALRDAGVPHRLLAGPWAHADPTTAMPGPADRPRRRDGARGSTAGCAAADGGGAPRTASTCSSARSTRPEPDLDLHEGYWIRDALAVAAASPVDVRAAGRAAARCRSTPTSAPPPGSTAPGTCRGASPATSALDDARSLTWDVARRPAPVRRPAAGAAAGQRRRPGGLAVGQALRRLPGRHLGAGHPRHARPGLPRRRARRRRRRRWCPGEEYDVVRRPRRLRLRARRRAHRLRLSRRRRRLAQHRRSPGPGHAHRARGHAGAARSGAARGPAAGVVHPGRRAQQRGPGRRRLDDQPRRARRAPPRARSVTGRPTRCRTTAARPSATPAR